MDSMSLERFHRAQAAKWAGYGDALAEMRRGRKSGHWIWYVFPQLAGLGRSSTAREYAIRDLAEACDYLRDPVLRMRYEEIAAAVDEQLAAGVTGERLMGGEIDALKLASSVTLFRAAALRLAEGDAGFAKLAELCDGILGRTTAQGYGPCAFTMERFGGETGG